MPAPEATFRHVDSKPALGHVNLMADTFIANATVDDLRSIVRNLLATGPPGIAPAFSNAARLRLRQTSTRPIPAPYLLFHAETRHSPATPLPPLDEVLARVRSMYGAGLGFLSLTILASIVRATIGLRWEDDGDMADILAVIDADIGQAIQSSKEEIQGSRIADFASAREARESLRRAVQESMDDVKSWGGEPPFEGASASLEHWKI